MQIKDKSIVVVLPLSLIDVLDVIVENVQTAGGQSGYTRSDCVAELLIECITTTMQAGLIERDPDMLRELAEAVQRKAGGYDA